MELVFDVVNAKSLGNGLPTSKTFRHAGGMIGRADDCDWVLPDRARVVSGRHAQISYRDGSFFLTDTSSNGTRKRDGQMLEKGQPRRIEHGDVFCLGEFEIRARLLDDPAVYQSVAQRTADSSIIPDDAFLDLDPLTALTQQESADFNLETESINAAGLDSQFVQNPDSMRVEMDNLLVPELVTPPPMERAKPQTAPPQPQVSGAFWDRYAEALGVALDDLDQQQREALALNAARLLRQCVSGLQQSLRTRSELKSEMRLAQTQVQTAGNNPLKQPVDTGEALTGMLRSSQAGQLPAAHAVSRAFRDIQTHQVALLAASRALVKGVLEQLSPDQLTHRLDQDSKAMVRTDGGRWRAYSRLHQSMLCDEDLSKKLFARDFAMAYEEQARLIATLNTDFQG